MLPRIPRPGSSKVEVREFRATCEIMTSLQLEAYLQDESNLQALEAIDCLRFIPPTALPQRIAFRAFRQVDLRPTKLWWAFGTACFADYIEHTGRIFGYLLPEGNPRFLSSVDAGDGLLNPWKLFSVTVLKAVVHKPRLVSGGINTLIAYFSRPFGPRNNFEAVGFLLRLSVIVDRTLPEGTVNFSPICIQFGDPRLVQLCHEIINGLELTNQYVAQILFEALSTDSIDPVSFDGLLYEFIQQMPELEMTPDRAVSIIINARFEKAKRNLIWAVENHHTTDLRNRTTVQVNILSAE